MRALSLPTVVRQIHSLDSAWFRVEQVRRLPRAIQLDFGSVIVADRFLLESAVEKR